MNRLIWVALAVACCSAAAAQPRKSKAERALDAEYNRIALLLKGQFVRGLKDPDSARFAELFLSAGESEDAPMSLCGSVNAKNSYGGYTGEKRFLITAESLVAIEPGDPVGSFNAVWPVWCSRPLLTSIVEKAPTKR